jgi:hypothetical protein
VAEAEHPRFSLFIVSRGQKNLVDDWPSPIMTGVLIQNMLFHVFLFHLSEN